MIEAGRREQISWGDGNWVFLDVGFSERKRSSGLLIAGEKSEPLRFADATRKIVEHVKCAASLTSLVIEAPLSVCFDKNDNPTGRKIEKELIDSKTKTCYWHQACGIMIAAMYLMRAVADARPKHSVRLFEGFVSYKKAGKRSDDCGDVELLREVVQQPGRFAECIVSGDDLRASPGDRIVSAFDVCGLKCGVPAIIKRAKA